MNLELLRIRDFLEGVLELRFVALATMACDINLG